MSEWQGTNTRNRKPSIGDVLAHDYSAWEILGIDPADEPRGIKISIKKLYGRHDFNRGTLTVTGWRSTYLPIYEGSRVPLCSCCAMPFPCRESDAERIAADEMALMEKRMARAGVPGICYACGEVITTRQKSLTYPAGEGNVQLPGYPSPRFHMRDQCGNARWSYARARSRVFPDKLAFDPDYARQELDNLT